MPNKLEFGEQEKKLAMKIHYKCTSFFLYSEDFSFDIISFMKKCMGVVFICSINII